MFFKKMVSQRYINRVKKSGRNAEYGFELPECLQGVCISGDKHIISRKAERNYSLWLKTLLECIS
ncbi:MAG: hypothetical protein CVU67_06850 [Deltaproteobacteria bacterium HGW-Deltaproteobacteria-24]|nr:MAG: hypothetical protein CVU67_06850 [Deltaproteobacteria bacterium HGW-Deltaproteobacteria-24]